MSGGISFFNPTFNGTKEAGEAMLSKYSYCEMEKLLARRGWLIYDHLTPGEITERYFTKFNEAYPKEQMQAFDNVNYCLAVRE